jgi:hypothetical protein
MRQYSATSCGTCTRSTCQSWRADSSLVVLPLYLPLNFLLRHTLLLGISIAICQTIHTLQWLTPCRLEPMKG